MNNCTHRFPSAHSTISTTSEPQSQRPLWTWQSGGSLPSSHIPPCSALLQPSVFESLLLLFSKAEPQSQTTKSWLPGVLGPEMCLSSSTHSFPLKQVVISGVGSDQKPIYANYCLFSTRNKAFRDKRISEQVGLKIFLSPKATVQSRPLISWNLLFLQLILLTAVSVLRECSLWAIYLDSCP